jgi:25S rRNA (uracil2843-N3)-methyltransferase
VDIADWSSVVDRLARTIQSPAVPATKSHPAPLQSEGADSFVVRFERADVLSLAEEGLRKLLHLQDAAAPARTVLVTLMFTLNELFSTSMAKTTEFLLRATDMLTAGTVFLVVDSPGSYSTLKLGKSAKKDAEADGASAAPQERRYPMKFLLDHTLLSVAAGKWEKVYKQDSRWWRRDAARLRYYVGEGAGLEDMRFQIHVYRRLAE